MRLCADDWHIPVSADGERPSRLDGGVDAGPVPAPVGPASTDSGGGSTGAGSESANPGLAVDREAGVVRALMPGPPGAPHRRARVDGRASTKLTTEPFGGELNARRCTRACARTHTNSTVTPLHPLEPAHGSPVPLS